jgi:hypothetical protein
MDAPVKKSAWQPLTPAGVAAFAGSSMGRLLLAQLVFALLTAAGVMLFLSRDWAPIVSKAIARLPAHNEIRGGRLRWDSINPTNLAEGRFLALAVDLQHQGQARSPAHLQIEFGEKDLKLLSLLGFVQKTYPTGWRIAFNREELEPWWGAWAPALVAIAGGLTVCAQFVLWTVLGTLYFGPVWFAAFFANRDLRASQCWRLCGAALMPGSLLLSGAIALYALGALDLIELAVGVALHIAAGGVWAAAALAKVPKHPVALISKNPFAAVQSGTEKR